MKLGYCRSRLALIVEVISQFVELLSLEDTSRQCRSKVLSGERQHPIPDYDRNSNIKKSADGFTEHHGYNYVCSELLNDLLVSFQCQPIINEYIISIFNLWKNLEIHEVPDLIFLGNY